MDTTAEEFEYQQKLKTAQAESRVGNFKKNLKEIDRKVPEEEISHGIKKIEKYAKSLTPMGAVSMAGKVKAGDMVVYGIAFSLALFKDILDLAIGLIPGVVTIISILIGIAIAFVLLFDGVSAGQRAVVKGMAKKMLILAFGSLIEGIGFGLNYLPLETLTVAVIYWMSLAERKK